MILDYLTHSIPILYLVTQHINLLRELSSGISTNDKNKPPQPRSCDGSNKNNNIKKHETCYILIIIAMGVFVNQSALLWLKCVENTKGEITYDFLFFYIKSKISKLFHLFESQHPNLLCIRAFQQPSRF